MYYFLGVSLLLALLLALNIFISLAASFLWRVLDAKTRNLTARQRTQMILALRVFPLILTIILVFAFVIPSYWLFEPEVHDEKVTLKLAIPALLSLAGIGVAIYRIFGTWWQTRRLVKDWRKNSEPMTLENFSLPVFRLRHHFPVIAVVGVFRPQLFIAESVFSSLSKEELAAAIEHECGHLAAHDNFKRVLMRLCRDLLVFPMGKPLERAWAENSESAADEYAAQIHRETALNLASALIKVAKIVPQNSSPAMPSGAFLIEKSAANITERVQRLIYLCENTNSLNNSFFSGYQFFVPVGSIALFFAVIFLATNQNFLFQIHTILEKVVGILQ